MSATAVFVGAILLLVVLILVEGKRQERRYGKGRGRGASLARTGLMDLQRHLEPERKIELNLRRNEREERDTSGDPKEPGRD